MAEIEIKVPSLGESETEATLVSWLKQVGDTVEVDDVLAEVESDKITMEITALDRGVLTRVLKQADDLVEPDEVIGYIDDALAPPREDESAEAVESEVQADVAEDDVEAAPAPVAEAEPESAEAVAPPAAETIVAADRQAVRQPMSRLRRRIAERLKASQNTAAMLTTFNEVNLQAVMELRSRYGAAFQQQHGVKLGFMSFFVRAVSQALAAYPMLNAYIDGDDVVYHNYVDVGIAVSAEKGLVVPVLRDAQQLSLAEIELGIADLARRAREGGLSPDDLKGGTFSITNGGIFGSMLSTPILNPPQSGILGMHNIQKRPVVEGDAIVIRPMMYLALTYDHRLIDGADAVRFLVTVKEALEFPGRALLDL